MAEDESRRKEWWDRLRDALPRASDFAERTRLLAPMVRELYPSIPIYIIRNMAEHGARPDDGLDRIERAVENAARHVCTNYDAIVNGANREILQCRVRPIVAAILEEWQLEAPAHRDDERRLDSD